MHNAIQSELTIGVGISVKADHYKIDFAHVWQLNRQYEVMYMKKRAMELLVVCFHSTNCLNVTR